MKKLLIIIVSVLALSCNNPTENPQELEKLITRISTLEAQNKILKDSLSSIDEEFLNSLLLLGFADNPIIKVGEKTNVVMLLQSYNQKIPKYEIFKIDGNKEIKIGQNDGTIFNIDFIPRSIEEDSSKILLKIPHKGKIIEVGGVLKFVVRK